MEPELVARIEPLRQEMSAKGEDAFLVVESKNRRYLSGFSGSAGWLIVCPKSLTIITDGRYWSQIEELGSHLELFRYLPLEHGSLASALTAALKELTSAGATIAVEIDDMPLALYRDIDRHLQDEGYKLKEVEGRVRQARAKKDSRELALLKQAAAIADEAFIAALARFHLGMTEASLRAELDYEAQKRGAEGTSFPTIVASGSNGSFPHAGASEKIVCAHELITIDFGVLWRGYCSDMTRTVWYGQLGQKDLELVSHVLKAQKLAVSKARAGIEAGALDAVARSYLAEAGWGDFFTHSLGHGVGLDVHEAPMIRAQRKDLLEVGHVITIEPGLYVPGLTGCRIEDTVVIASKGCEVLNHAPKQAPEEEHPALALCN